MQISQLEKLRDSAVRFLAALPPDAPNTPARGRLLFNAGFSTLLLTPGDPAGVAQLEACLRCQRALLETPEADWARRGAQWHLRSLAEWLVGQPYDESLQRACVALGKADLVPAGAADLVRSWCELGERESIVEFHGTHAVAWRAIFVTGEGAADAAWLRTLMQQTLEGAGIDRMREALRRQLRPRPDGLELFELPVMAQYCRIAAAPGRASSLLAGWQPAPR
jgi:hypothetical protein